MLLDKDGSLGEDHRALDGGIVGKACAESDLLADGDLEKLCALVDASWEKVSWERFLEENGIIVSSDSNAGNAKMATAWTLQHGDFHPMNCTVRRWPQTDSSVGASNADAAFESVLFDWDMVGLGNGAQEIGQFLISHMEPGLRKECWEEVLRKYYDRVVKVMQQRGEEKGDTEAAAQKSSYSWETCREHYVKGSMARWIFLLANVFVDCPAGWGPIFVKSVLAFAEDHGITAETVSMPN